MHGGVKGPFARTTEATSMRRILLEFIGGSWDGMNLCNDSPDPVEVGLALHTYCQAGNGHVGQTAVMPADYAVRPGGVGGCKYVVTDRTELGDEVLIRLEVCWSERRKPCVCMAKRLVLQFEGGGWHGRSLDSQSADTHEALLAVAYYCVTDQGTVGKACDWRPTAAWLQRDATGPAGTDIGRDCHYRVTQRIEDEERVLVRFEWRAKDERNDRYTP
jgi:hypothetical protein